MWDVIVVGGGHNGVITAVTLARHGLRVAIIEKNPWLGGLASGLSQGVPISLYAYAVGLVPRELDEWLGLLKGLLHKPDPSWVEIEDGEVTLRWWRSRERLSLEAREAGVPGLPHLIRLIDQFWTCYKAAGLYYTPNPPSPDEAAAVIDKCSPEAAGLLERSVESILRRYLDPSWWPTIIYPSMLQSNGFALAYYLQNGGVWDQPIGGMGSLSKRLAALARSEGVTLFTGERVTDVLVENGRAKGVKLASGRSVRARLAVVYSAPIYTLPYLPTPASLLGEDTIKTLRRLEEYRVQVRRVDYLLSRPPRPPREPGWRGYPIISYWVQDVGGEFTFPSLYSDMGLHIVQASGSSKPLNPAPPGVEEGDIIAWWERGPETQAMCCGNTTGHPDHVPLRDPFIMDGRPLPGWHDYTTDIPGLYHASASSYPGGEINGVAGHNAALRILLDNGIKPRTPLYRGPK
ncbi:MAG: NAD(P)/FAD-dependent oxidoreductase [Desulfurococcales archaeon]|nr:NAD(P)/FAD-dependent oxidoreductase [Desulfurococcales archaeon]